MNRAERRKAAKEQRNNNIGRNTNSKHNFVDMGKWDIPINELKQDENLKDPNADPEVMELFNEVYTKWMGSTLVKNLYSKVLITLGMEYLDTLTSLKFNLIPSTIWQILVISSWELVPMVSINHYRIILMILVRQTEEKLNFLP